MDCEKCGLALLDALRVFCHDGANLFIETVSPSILQRILYWRMRSSYKTHLHADTLYPRPSIFHIKLSNDSIDTLQEMFRKHGYDVRSIAHIKGYIDETGLFWFHGFSDEPDRTLCCSCHVSETIIESLESELGVKAEKKYGELESDRERKENLGRILQGLENLHEKAIRGELDEGK